jgi:hypothetical protein
VYRPDGELIYTEPTATGMSSGADDHFGSKVIYSRIAADNQAEIWLDDAEQSHPVKLATLPAGCANPQVSIWGELMAWSPACGAEITVRNVRLDTALVVPKPSSDLSRLQLSEGTLTWTGVNDRVLDLTTENSLPVTLPGISSLIAVDDHRVARQERTDDALTTDLRMSRLPFTPKYPPRLIGRLGPLGFTPDGDGHADTWAPQFDVTKPLRKATLKITTLSGGRTLQVLTTDATDGSLRGLLWDGRTSQGATLPTGTYRWTLTGRAADGDGSLIAADGTPTVTGTIEIDAIA